MGVSVANKKPDHIVYIIRLTDEDLAAEINKGIEDIREGRVVDGEKAVSKIRAKYSI